MDMRRAQALLVEEARTRMGYLIAAVPIQEKSENLREISRVFEALASCKLLVEADVTAYVENLVRCAQARRYFLRKSQEEANTEDRMLAISRTRAVLAAVVANALPLAREIAAASIQTWNRDWEYEDDFCYYMFVHRMLLDRRFLAEPAAAALLERFETALEGQTGPRLSLCRALLARAEDEFNSAFEALLQEHAAVHDLRRATMTEYSANAMFWPNSFVSTEALAWLCFARVAGMEPRDDFPLCPAAGREIVRVADVPDLFESLDHALREAE